MLMLRWPLIQLAVSLEILSFADAALAERLLRHELDIPEETVAFLCHMTLAARDGHLCVKIEAGQLTPSPFLLWSMDGEEALPEKLVHLLEKLALGAASIPHYLITSVENSSSFPDTPLCLFKNCYYLQKNWLYETLFLEQLRRLLRTPPELEFSLEKVSKEVGTLQENGVLEAFQADAIIRASQVSLFAISGGPGTGKTYTAAQLIHLFFSLLDPFQKTQYRIGLAAPTGKAVAHLQNQLAQIEGVEIQAKTLHALLNVRADVRWEASPALAMPYDLIIVDECSMIDVRLMGMLLASVKPGARLILLGDSFQLPSVEAGSLFADMMQVLDASYRAELKTCLRTDNKDLREFAEAVKQGKKPLKNFSSDEMRNILSAAEERFLILQSGKNPEQFLFAFQQFRLLSPLRKGPFGVEEMNAKLYCRLSHRAAKASFFAVPIMITKNDYKRQLFNGEVGVLIREGIRREGEVDHRVVVHTIQEEDYALFPGREALRRIPAVLLPSFELAYCLSVHKSQGSEFDSVFLLLPEGTERFGREVLYTAATRARRELVIWGEEHVLEETLKKTAHRLSGVSERFQ